MAGLVSTHCARALAVSHARALSHAAPHPRATQTCDDYDDPEEAVVNLALAASIPGTDSGESFSKHVCTDVTRRRGLLSSTVSIAVTADVIIEAYVAALDDASLSATALESATIQTVDTSVIIADVTETITSAVSSGALVSAMVDAAANADDDIAVSSSVDFGTVSVDSVAISTMTPTAAPTPAKATGAPTPPPPTTTGKKGETDVLLVPHSVLYALGAGMLLVTACCCVASRKSADSRRARSGRLSFSRMYASKSGMRGIEARDDRAGMV